MATKNVSLPAEQVEYIDAKVASGEYAHSSEVVRDAIRMMMEEEVRKLEWLRRAIQEGIDAEERGELISGDELFSGLTSRQRASRPGLSAARARRR